MQFAIDATPILSRGKGLAVFLETLLDHLSRSDMLKPKVIYIDESFFEEAARRWPGMPLRAVRSRPSVIWEKILLPRLARKDSIDILLTGRDRTACEPHCRTIVYLFEVPDYRIGQTLNGKHGWYAKAAALATRFYFTSVTRAVTHIIVSSHSTRNDLLTHYKIPADKITVVYPGLRTGFHRVDHGRRTEARQYFTGGNPYILHFATGDPRDNTATALAAFSQALAQLDKDVMLLLVGSGANTAVKKEAMRFGLEGRICVRGFLTVDELTLSYVGAEAYLDPTLYEGFGLQPLEAMACGVPVLSSRVTSVPEVVGDAAMLFDPHDVDGFASGLARILNETDLQKLMIARGFERAKQFTWEKAIGQLASTFEAIGRKNGA